MNNWTGLIALPLETMEVKALQQIFGRRYHQWLSSEGRVEPSPFIFPIKLVHLIPDFLGLDSDLSDWIVGGT